MTYTIGLDCDGVLYAWEKTARYMLRRKYALEGRIIPTELYESSTHWDMIQNCITVADWKWLWSEGVEQGLFRYGHGYPGFIEGAEALAELGDVVLITSRPKTATTDTIAWVHLMLNKVDLAGIRILSHSEPKSSVRPLPNIFIDDALHNLEELVPNTPKHCRVVLFDQPWNQRWEAPWEDLSLEGRGTDLALDSKWRRGKDWPHTVDLVRAAREQKW